MKSLKAVYYPLMPVFLLGGLLTGGREFFLLFLAQALVVLLGAAMNVWTAYSFSYLQDLSAGRCVKGETLTLNIRISNDMPFPFALMKLRVETAAWGDERELVFDLAPSDSVRFELPVFCPYRGSYQVGMTKLELSDIFGLVTLRFDLRKLFFYRQSRLVVYPRLVELRSLPGESPDAKFFTGTRLRLSDEGEDGAGSRQYRAGDSFKRINWKQSAAKRELFTRIYELPEQARTLVALDNCAAPFAGEQRLAYADLACECAASIISRSLDRGHGAKLTVSAGRQEDLSADGPEGFARIYECLAVLGFENRSELLTRLREAGKTGDYRAVYVITASPTAELAKAVRELQAGGGCPSAVCLILSPDGVEADASAMEGVAYISVGFGEDLAQALGA